MKKIYFIIMSLFSFILFSYLYLINPVTLNSIDKKIKDSFFLIRGEINTTNLITIVNIDEKSLSKFGHWPWERKIIARIIDNLVKSKAGIIGFDIFFPESSSNKISDYILAERLKNSPSVLGIMFDFEKNTTKNSLPNIPAIFIQKNFQKEFLPVAKGYLANIPILQNAAYSSGFVNMFPDIDGVTRKIPLIIKYKDSFYNFLAFEMYRLAYGVNKIIINYSPVGIESIELDNNLSIKTDRFGRIIINYRGKKGKFKYISAADIYNNTFDKNLIKNRFVIIGTTAAGLFDLRSTPIENVFPGVEIQATILDELLKKDIIHFPQNKEVINIFILFVLTILIFLIHYKLPAIYSFIGTISILLILYFFEYFIFLKYLVILNSVYPIILIISLSVALSTLNYFFEYKKEQMIKKAFAKRVSQKVMKELLKNPESILTPKKKEITIYFSDIRGFTSISEKLSDPIKIINFLNDYFTPVSEIIMEHCGTIDKYIGDAVMAYWNAPNDCKNHADFAVSCAIKHLKILNKLNTRFKKKYNISINIGIGINTGVATIGEMGSKGRADYTVIGDSVNLASRLEGLNKFYSTHILISEYTKKLLTKEYIIREIDTVKVKGKNEPVTIYEVIDFGKKDFSLYNKALKLYKNKKFKEALNIFESLYKTEKLKIYSIYINRCKKYIKNPNEFSLYYKFDTK